MEGYLIMQNLRPLEATKRKGNALSTIGPVALTLVIAIFVVSMGATILGKLKDTQTSGTAEYNITDKGITGLGQFGDWWTVIVLAVILGIIVFVLYAYLGGALGGRKGRY